MDEYFGAAHNSLSQNVSRIDQATQRQTWVPGVWSEWSLKCHWQCAHGMTGEASSSQSVLMWAVPGKHTAAKSWILGREALGEDSSNYAETAQISWVLVRWGSDGHGQHAQETPTERPCSTSQHSARSGADRSWEKTVTKADHISMAAAASKPQTWGLAYLLGNLALDLGGTQQRKGCDLRLLLSRIS